MQSNTLGGAAMQGYALAMKCPFLILSVVVMTMALGACYGVPVQPVPYETARDIPPDARLSPIGLKKIVLAIPRGDTIGSTSPRGLGLLCRGPYGMVTRSIITGHMEKPSMREAFTDTMESQGYDVTGSPALMFDEDDDEARTIYAIGARITDIKMDVCQRVTFFLSYDLGYTGETSMEVEWTVYDRLKRETVYKTMTRGYSRMDLPNYEAIGLMLDDSFAAAAHNLGADEKFNALIVRGTMPSSGRKDQQDPIFGPATKFDSREIVTLPKGALRTEQAAPVLDRLRRNAVMIGTGAGHGSGFFIGDEGYIITNDHVVGDADRVRVVTAGGDHKLVGEVLRRDTARDIALIRVEDMPKDFHPVLLPVRRDIPRVGEDVYAIGAPISEKDLQDTVTKGIISAFRPYDRWDRQSFIQADVSIHPGNSGGPLLDVNGNIIGVSVAGYADENGNSLSGLNLFIPIEDALDKLDIQVVDNTLPSPVNLVP